MNDLIWIGNTLYPRWFAMMAFLVFGFCAVVLIALLLAALSKIKRWLWPDGIIGGEQPAVYDGIEIAGARSWQQCDGGWFKTTGIIHVHTIDVDGVKYVDAMRIEQ